MRQRRCEHGFLPPLCLVCHQKVSERELEQLAQASDEARRPGGSYERLVDGKVVRTCVLCPDDASRGGFFCNHHRRLLNDTKRRQKTRAYRRGPYSCSICGRHGHTAKTHDRFGFDGDPPQRRCHDCNEPLPPSATTKRCRRCLDDRERKRKERKKAARRRKRFG